MDAYQDEARQSIDALADAVQRDLGIYCHVGVGRHPDGDKHVRVDICISSPGDPYESVTWDTMLDGSTITEVRDMLAQWLAERRKECAA